MTLHIVIRLNHDISRSHKHSIKCYYYFLAHSQRQHWHGIGSLDRKQLEYKRIIIQRMDMMVSKWRFLINCNFYTPRHLGRKTHDLKISKIPLSSNTIHLVTYQQQYFHADTVKTLLTWPAHIVRPEYGLTNNFYLTKDVHLWTKFLPSNWEYGKPWELDNHITKEANKAIKKTPKKYDSKQSNKHSPHIQTTFIKHQHLNIIHFNIAINQKNYYRNTSFIITAVNSEMRSIGEY